MVKRVTVKDKYEAIQKEKKLQFGNTPKKSNITINYTIQLYVTDEDVESVKISSGDLREGKYDSNLLTKGVEHIRKKYNGTGLKVVYVFNTGQLHGELLVGELFQYYKEDVGKMIYKLLVDIDSILRVSTTRFEFLIRYFLLKTMYKDNNLFNSGQGTRLSAICSKKGYDDVMYSDVVNEKWKANPRQGITYGKVIRELQTLPIELRSREEKVKGVGVLYLKVGAKGRLININMVRSNIIMEREIDEYMSGGYGMTGRVNDIPVSLVLYMYIIKCILDSFKKGRTMTDIKGITGDLYPLREDATQTKSGANLIYNDGLISYEDFDSILVDNKYREVVKDVNRIYDRDYNLLEEMRYYFLIADVIGSVAQIFHIVYSTNKEFREYIDKDNMLDKKLRKIVLYDTINNSYAISKLIGFIRSGIFDNR